MSTDINKFFPYNKMKLVTVDGQQMLRIPKIYVKNEVISKGRFAGKTAFFMAEHPYKGYHVHPAFMNMGSQMSFLDLSCYEASKGKDGKPQSVPKNSGITISRGDRRSEMWQEITQPEAIRVSKLRNTSSTDPDKSGWHCWDIYCHHLLARIMLFEFGTTSFIEQSAGTPEYVYRGIHQPAGNPNAPLWLPGIMKIGGNIHVADNMGEGAMINTGVKAPANGWPTSFSMAKGAAFDLGDLFIAEKTSTKMLDGTCSDYQKFTAARTRVAQVPFITAYRGPTFSDETLPAQAEGMFAFTCPDGYVGTVDINANFAVWHGFPTWDDDGGPLRFRLAHWVK